MINLGLLPDMDDRIFTIITYGCQMNRHDSEIMRALMEDRGYQWTEDPGEAGVIILNTCSVREHAEKRVLGLLGNLKQRARLKPGMIIAIGGCMAENRETREYILKKVPHVKVIFGTRSYHHLPELIDQARRENTPQVLTGDGDRQLPGILPACHENSFQAYVTIMYGCNNFCSYCIVPYTRGREQSRPVEEIYREITALVERGYLEVTLLGQNVNSYGKDLGDGSSFAGLLRKLDQIPGLSRIRYMTSHPRDFTDELIETIARSDKVCEHFHLPLQAGSDRILKLMNRGYTAERYLKLVEKIRRAVPGAAITTDLIVGFPGESEDDFLATLEMIERVRFDAAYTFIFSPRKGTPAATMPDQLPVEVAKERLNRLIRVQNRISLELNREQIGQTKEVLVEGRSKTNPDRWSGRTRTNKIVVFEATGELEGKPVQVTITDAHTFTLYGVLK